MPENGVVETPNPIESISDKTEVSASNFEPDFESYEEISILDDEQSVKVEPPLVDRLGPRRSSRVRKLVSRYIPSMTGTKYAYVVTQLCEDGVVHLYAHTFVQN